MHSVVHIYIYTWLEHVLILKYLDSLGMELDACRVMSEDGGQTELRPYAIMGIYAKQQGNLI